MKISIRLISVALLFLISGFIFTSGCSSEPKKGGAEKTDSTEVAAVAANSLPKMLDLGSVYCIPCKQMAPILDSLKVLYDGKAEIAFIDVREDKESARKYGITMIPTQVFFDRSGAEIYRHIGFFPDDSITAHLQISGMEM